MSICIGRIGYQLGKNLGLHAARVDRHAHGAWGLVEDKAMLLEGRDIGIQQYLKRLPHFKIVCFLMPKCPVRG